MVMAAINPDDTQKFELRTIEEGFVVLRPMSYDTYLKRRDMTTQIRLASNKKGSEEFAGELAMLNQKVALFEFKECIVEHNLEIADGELFDFSKPTSLRRLNPRVGQEISEYISEMNEMLEDDELGN